MRDLPDISLDGFAPSWGDFEHTWGTPVLYKGEPWKDQQYHCEILGRYDHDYLGAHLFVQVWDYAQQDDPDQRWQYVLLIHAPLRVWDDGAIVATDWAWYVRCHYESNDSERRFPTFAEVGADVDAWLQAPDALRFLLIDHGA